jgi:hypothetical protein
VTVDPANRAPAAVEDLKTAVRDTTLTVAAQGVLANDTDADGDSLTASLTVGPLNGRLLLRPDGSFEYRAAPGFSGADAFRYVAFDGSLYSAPTTVTIRVSAPVHRFYNTRTGVHFYTISEVERATVLAHAEWPFVYEGVAYQAFAGPVPGTTPVHRFYNYQSNVHFYTASEEERASVVAHTDWPFTSEGVVFFVIAAQTSDSGPVYRFYNAAQGAHFYTASEAERDVVGAGAPRPLRLLLVSLQPCRSPCPASRSPSASASCSGTRRCTWADARALRWSAPTERARRRSWRSSPATSIPTPAA